MYANVTTFHRRPERLDQVGLYDVVSVLHSFVAYRGAYVLVDHQSGLQLTITLWDTEAAMNAAIAELQPLREQRATDLKDTAPPRRQPFEVVACDPPNCFDEHPVAHCSSATG